MTVLPDFDPYEALGVTKDATLTDIKSSHRKLVLKCHPDKIKDESQRSQAQDQFQKVQQAYECLSDETSRAKYDNKVKLAELKREMMSRGGSYSRSNTREYRDGRYYEERVPADPEVVFEDEARFAESPRPSSRKHEEYGARPRSRATEEKRRAKTHASSTARAAKEAAKDARESAKATRADRDKYRTKERRRQTHDKYGFVESDYSESDSGRSEVLYYIPVKRPSDHKRHRDSKPRPTESSRRSKAHYDDDDYSDDYRHDKHDMQYSSARDYIRRSKETIAETDRRHRSSRSPLRYDSPEPEHSSRSKRSTRESRPPTSHHSSFEHLEPRVPSMPTAATFPGPMGSSSPRTSQPPKSSARAQSRSNRESARRSEPVHMYTRLRGEKSDSGYASSSPTPETVDASPKPRYKNRPEPVIVEPSTGTPPPLRHSRTYSPPRPERQKPVRSTTYAYPPEASTSTRRHLYREVEKDPRQVEKEIRHAREVQPDIHYIRPQAAHSQSYHDKYAPPVGRRQSAY